MGWEIWGDYHITRHSPSISALEVACGERQRHYYPYYCIDSKSMEKKKKDLLQTTSYAPYTPHWCNPRLPEIIRLGGFFNWETRGIMFLEQV